MTDLPLPPATHPPPPQVDSLVTPNATPSLPLPLPLTNGFPAPEEEEEDYTIKCICGYQDDDGNTVQCETCETWQHIECYYGGKKAPGVHEVHNCADCEPRPLDGKRATERQRARREELDVGDRKPKKPTAPAKSHKKKSKATDQPAPVNGWAVDRADGASPRNGSSGSPREQPPAKRQKMNHRASNSMHHTSTVPLKPPAQSRRSVSTSHALQSPSKTPTAISPTEAPFSAEFVRLYDDDPGDTELPANLFNDIGTTSNLALWTHDVEAVEEATNGRTQQDIFMRCDEPLDSMALPPLAKQVRVADEASPLCHGRRPRWVYLTVEADVPPNAIVGELRGAVGHMRDYARNPANRWEYLRHPLPFVFFHPHLPIYIDARREGTACRYLRRSCRPNVTMKTILENEADYRFCFVANRALEAGTELTVAWTLDEHVRAYSQRTSGAIKHEGASDADDAYVRNYFRRVAADFGGCACDAGDDCLVAMWERRGRALAASEPTPTNGKTKSRKSKAKNKENHHANTATAATSRSGSEALRYPDEDDADDGHSTAPSSKSKTHSRDPTPSHQMGDGGIAQAIEASGRDKRKIAEFEKKEAERSAQAPKRRKGTSGGASAHPASTSNAVSTLSARDVEAVAYQDQKSGPSTANVLTQPGSAKGSRPSTTNPSPTAKHPIAHPPSLPSPRAPKKNYVDAAMQTDPDLGGDWLLPATSPTRASGSGLLSGSSPSPPPGARLKPRFVSVTQRLLRRSHEAKVRQEEARQAMQAMAVQLPQKSVDLQALDTSGAAVPANLDGDVAMANAGVGVSEGQSTAASQVVIDTGQSRKTSSDGAAPTVASDSAASLPGPLNPPPLSTVPATASAASSTPTSAHDTHPSATSTAHGSTTTSTSTGTSASPVNAPNGTRPHDLRVQLPPRLPYSSSAAGTAHQQPSPMSGTPLTATQLPPPSPALPTLTTAHAATGTFAAPHHILPPGTAAAGLAGGAAVQPSPVKKISLGDYLSSRRLSTHPKTPGESADKKDKPASEGAEKRDKLSAPAAMPLIAGNAVEGKDAGDGSGGAGSDQKDFGNATKPLGALSEDTKVKVLGGSAITETPPAEADTGDPMEAVEKTA